MGTRPKFIFDPPEEIYAMRYAEVVKEIEADLFKWQEGIIESFENEFPDEYARMLSFIAGNSDRPEKILERAASGILGPECRDQMTLAIAHLADYHTKKYVRGYWPDWSKE